MVSSLLVTATLVLTPGGIVEEIAGGPGCETPDPYDPCCPVDSGEIFIASPADWYDCLYVLRSNEWSQAIDAR